MSDKLSIQKRNTRFSIAYQAPSLILYTVFLAFPTMMSLYYSLLKWNGITAPRFVGLSNFVKLFTIDRYFWDVLKNTCVSMAAGILIQMVIALIFAYLVYRTKRGFHFYQSVYFVPVVISATIIGLMFTLLFNSTFGPVNTILGALGLESLQHSWLSDPSVVLFSVIFPGIWQYIGYHFIILLAGMQSIPEEIMESAVIDGANSVAIFFRIVIPNILGMIQVSVILNLVGSIKTFDIPYLMTQGGPGAKSSFLSIYMYKEAFINSNLGKGTAIAVCMLVLAVGITTLVNAVFRRINRDK